MTIRKVMIDTDCGSDDAMAILMALRDESCRIVMFSTVSGNVRVKQATANLLTTIRLAGTYAPPVYMGCSEMLKREFAGAADTHGEDGMGDLDLVDYSLTADEGHGVDRMIEMLKNSEDRSIDLITLGPLTNIAMAIRKDPVAMRRIRKVYAMATSVYAGGNVTDLAEFNVWHDAEAFKEVLDFGFEDLTLVSWDASLNEAVLNEADIEKLKGLSDLGRFCVDTNRILLKLNQQRFHEDILDMADPAAMFAALHPEYIRECEAFHLEVDTKEGPAYGFVSFDRIKKAPQAMICTKIDAKAYKNYIYEQLK